ncbi:energy-coupling factor ABC transporter permease [Paraburkholderia bonniea]|uniref:energy-coupling factor ABC transporter permease n=1 Tax=Paraburkholderia bonniea TaxID=2152891 RepID=UPI00129166A7|nr:energy-coupling factor ABC transporter permease [Paraburkholderia bonniea]WJF91565.1 energy-coupling factor ABC transporter permease [Paraburkholderia bonniea]WJF95474.1 energy-coupling factor ABC transporter permease [Paraburkholderia bonniea]
MGFLYTPLPLWVAFGSWAIAAGLLLLAGWKNPFQRLRDTTLQHAWFAIVVAITVLWACNAWMDDGTVIHLLGATLLVTLFDWPLALIAMAAIIGLAASVFDAPWQGIGLTFVVFGAIPVAASALLQRAFIALLPGNPLTYILSQGFALPACAAITTLLAALAVHAMLTGNPLAPAPTSYAVSTLLLTSAEAWFTGISTLLIAIYRPAWITTYDVQRYRLGKPRL